MRRLQKLQLRGPPTQMRYFLASDDRWYISYGQTAPRPAAGCVGSATEDAKGPSSGTNTEGSIVMSTWLKMRISVADYSGDQPYSAVDTLCISFSAIGRYS